MLKQEGEFWKIQIRKINNDNNNMVKKYVNNRQYIIYLVQFVLNFF